ncbi:Uu.00g073860.m01.CDS01 [Anthostomella pinea]|uniref:Uu.00g073860.m01.CDS01 n=1 Tax=Anthostomella pinea TaxID=933095 RepID=A0AAI8VVD7_9PEZI|nr:Uu.00g073860.m01.CDS01 [Anthostomella pinea]
MADNVGITTREPDDEVVALAEPGREAESLAGPPSMANSMDALESQPKNNDKSPEKSADSGAEDLAAPKPEDFEPGPGPFIGDIGVSFPELRDDRYSLSLLIYLWANVRDFGSEKHVELLQEHIRRASNLLPSEYGSADHTGDSGPSSTTRNKGDCSIGFVGGRNLNTIGFP